MGIQPEQVQRVRPVRAAEEPEGCWDQHVAPLSVVSSSTWSWVVGVGMACRTGIAASELAQVAAAYGYAWGEELLRDCRVIVAELIRLDQFSK